MDKQSYDTSRLFTTDSGPSCGYNYYYDCPILCDCGSYSFNETWHVETEIWSDYLWGNKARCSKCTCKSDGDNLYADCDYGID